MQYGFFFDQSRCNGCQTCAIACKSIHELPPGPLKFLRIYQYETGVFPNVRLRTQWVPCYHCENPICMDNCAMGAMYKEEKYGAVLIDKDKCNGCRECYEACPYGAPVFASDEPGTEVQKCDMCIDRLDRGDPPVCALACPMRALDFGPLNELQAKYGYNRDLPDLPRSGETQPAVVFEPARDKRRLFPYDARKALELLRRRDSLPEIYTSPSDVAQISEGMVGRDKLVLKHHSCADLMKATRNDDG
ncbi:MAG: 4Fe-4S dicluster domain-containing protein [Terriglobales bacterium]